MEKLQQAILDSRMRIDNLKSAMQLGFFGLDKIEVVKNLEAFNLEKQPIIDQQCNDLNLFFKEKNLI